MTIHNVISQTHKCNVIFHTHISQVEVSESNLSFLNTNISLMVSRNLNTSTSHSKATRKTHIQVTKNPKLQLLFTGLQFRISKPLFYVNSGLGVGCIYASNYWVHLFQGLVVRFGVRSGYASSYYVHLFSLKFAKFGSCTEQYNKVQ